VRLPTVRDLKPTRSHTVSLHVTDWVDHNGLLY